MEQNPNSLHFQNETNTSDPTRDMLSDLQPPDQSIPPPEQRQPVSEPDQPVRDSVYERWVGVPRLEDVVNEPPAPENNPDQLVVGGLPNGQDYWGPRSGWNDAMRYAEGDRLRQTLDNVRGGPAGAIGYGINGDKGSDVGALIDGPLNSLGRTPQEHERPAQAPEPVRPGVIDINPPPTPEVMPVQVQGTPVTEVHQLADQPYYADEQSHHGVTSGVGHDGTADHEGYDDMDFDHTIYG